MAAYSDTVELVTVAIVAAVTTSSSVARLAVSACAAVEVVDTAAGRSSVAVHAAAASSRAIACMAVDAFAATAIPKAMANTDMITATAMDGTMFSRWLWSDRPDCRRCTSNWAAKHVRGCPYWHHWD